MTRLALIQDNAILSLHRPGSLVTIDDDGVPVTVSPAEDGWSYKTWRLALVHGSTDTGTAEMVGNVPTWAASPLPSLDELLAHAAGVRYAREQGGMVWNGWPVATDDRSQGKINSEVLAVQVGERMDGDYWKFADGAFRSLSNADVVDLGRSARLHVKACFAVEGIVVSRIVGGVMTTFAAIDAYFEAAFAG